MSATGRTGGAVRAGDEVADRFTGVAPVASMKNSAVSEAPFAMVSVEMAAVHPESLKNVIPLAVGLKGVGVTVMVAPWLADTLLLRSWV